MKTLLWKLFGKKFLLGGVVDVYRWLTGYKTQVTSVLIGIIYAGKILGYIPADLADQLILVLGGIGGVTFMQKLKRIDDEYKVTQRAEELRKAAEAELAKDPEAKQ